MIPQQPTLSIAGDGALGHITASDNANAWDMEGFAHLSTACDVLGHLRIQQTFQSGSDIGDEIINDCIQTDINPLTLRQIARLRGRSNVETENNYQKWRDRYAVSV